MHRTKLKKTKVTAAGQKNISSFFSPQKDSTSSTKLSITAAALTKTEPRIKDGEAPPARLLCPSPSKRSVLRVLENLLPSSPDLLLSVPETPDSQMRPTSASPSRDPGRRCPQPSREVSSLEKAGQLSPLCRSPRSRGLGVRRVMTEEGGRAKREEGGSGSLKRLFSPPEESHNAKRPRTANTHALKPVIGPVTNSLKVTRPAIGPMKKPCSSDHIKSTGQSERSKGRGLSLSFSTTNRVGFSDSRKEVISLKPVSVRRVSPQSLVEPKQRQEQRAQGEEQPVFTVITEQKAVEQKVSVTPHTHTDVHTLNADTCEADTHTLDAHVHKPNTHTATVASAEERELGADGNGATGTAVTSSDRDRVAVTSSDQEGAGGTAGLVATIETDIISVSYGRVSRGQLV
uniref:uncharacterized protein n=1 Tax=Centroberyx gerrardi TaxID=166262 RepID=UPI003AAA2437